MQPSQRRRIGCCVALLVPIVLPLNACGLDLETDSQRLIFSANSGTWSEYPHASTIVQTSSGVIVAAWVAGGPLMLFYGEGPHKLPGQYVGRNLYGALKTSTNNGQSWSSRRVLGNAPSLPGGKLIGPTKNPSIQLPDGSILIPSSNGTSWSLGVTLDPAGGALAHYPQAVQTSDGKVHVVFTSGARAGDPDAIIKHVILNTGLNPERR